MDHCIPAIAKLLAKGTGGIRVIFNQEHAHGKRLKKIDDVPVLTAVRSRTGISANK
jgi:hypothetical protein